MKSAGIHLRLLVAAFLLISAATFALGVVGIRITQTFVNARLEDRISFLARYLAVNSEVGILINDKAGLERLAKNLLTEKDVARVTIFNKHGKVLANASREIPGPLSPVEAAVSRRRPRDISLLFSSDIPPKTTQKSDGETVGRVRITYSTLSIKQLMQTITLRFILLAGALASLAGLVFFLISRSIVAQVTHLADAARKVARGDLDLRAEPGRLPETRELALAFNSMLDSLAKSREALARADQEMMRKNVLAELGKFSLMIAHEVKNPLGIIKSSVDVLKKKPVDAEGAIMIAYMEDEIKRLNRLIDHFLAFARPGQPRFRPMDLNAMLKEVVSRFELQKTGTDLKIRAELPSSPCDTHADPDLLTRAFGNIIRNACEANEDRGLVRVAASCKENTWVAVVEDEGGGINPGNVDRVFEPFFTTRSKGSGLGLAFVSQVIQSHGGTITAENRKEGGARFRVALKIGERRCHGPDTGR